MGNGKKYNDSLKSFDREKRYSTDEALALLQSFSAAKYDETVELHFSLGIDTRKVDQQIRSSCVLPAGRGKSMKVLVFAEGDKADEAKEAGADFVGSDDLVAKIQKESWFGFDIAIATPNLMGRVGRIGRLLGPRGLMPNPKVGTITMDIKKAVEESKAGKVEFRADKFGNVHLPIGKRSFTPENLKKNLLFILRTILKSKPSAVKGQFIKSITICSTMSPGIKLDIASATLESKK